MSSSAPLTVDGLISFPFHFCGVKLHKNKVYNQKRKEIVFFLIFWWVFLKRNLIFTKQWHKGIFKEVKIHSLLYKISKYKTQETRTETYIGQQFGRMGLPGRLVSRYVNFYGWKENKKTFIYAYL
jgi:hypothetical protein